MAADGMNRRQRRLAAKRKSAGSNDAPTERLFRDAVARHQAGRLEAAALLYLQILAIDKRHADSLHWLGVVRHQQGRQPDAIELIRKAIDLRSDDPVYFNSLALTLHAQGDLQEAVACYERALALEPDEAEAYHSNLGVVQHVLGRREDAAANFRRALALNPDYVEAHNNLGNLLFDENELGAAADCFRRVLALQPNHAAAHNNLGMIARSHGRMEEARRCFETAIGLEPRKARYYANLGDTKRFSAGDPDLAAMQALAGAEALSTQDRIELGFALAKAHADLTEHEQSFRCLLEANRLQRQNVAYDEADALQSFRRIAQTYTRALIERQYGSGEQSSVPLFITGMPRSGTTLLEQILGSHPAVLGAGELDDFGDVVNGFTFSGELPEAAANLTGEELRQIGSRYVERIRRRAPEAARIVNKLPGNFLHVGLICLALPKARIIHVRRDPLDTCFSCFSKLFVRGEFTYDLAELGRFYAAYAKLMDHWRAVLPPGIMIEVAYEELVADLEPQARRIVEHVGLDWNPACLDFHKSDRPVLTASALQVRQPMYDSSIGRWRAYAPFLQPLIEAIGSLADPTSARQ